MDRESNIDMARALIAAARGDVPAERIATFFSRSLSFEVEGDPACLPWIGRKTGRAAAEAFFRALRGTTDVVRCTVEDVLGSECRAVIVGSISLVWKETGRLFTTPFAAILTFSGEEIVRFQVLDDTLGLSRLLSE